MSNFKELDENLDTVLDKLLSNQTICKLLQYDDMYALSQEDMENPKEELEYVKIFPYPKNTEVLDQASTILIVGFDEFKEIGATYIGSILYFRILCHPDLWRVEDTNKANEKVTRRRPYLLMHEISTLFNNQRVMGIGNLLFAGGGEIKDGNYTGFEIGYQITEFSQ